MARPDAPSSSAFLALADVDYNEDAWERDVDGWTIAFSLRRSDNAIRDKQNNLFQDDDNDVCREQDELELEDWPLFPTDYYERTSSNLITISRHKRNDCQSSTLYGFCLFYGNYINSNENTEKIKFVVTVEKICTAVNSFKGTGKFMLALLTKYAHARKHEIEVDGAKLVISQPLDEAKPFYEKLGFEECDGIDEMDMFLYDESDGVHFAPLEEMRGTKRRRSDRLMLLVG